MLFLIPTPALPASDGIVSFRSHIPKQNTPPSPSGEHPIVHESFKATPLHTPHVASQTPAPAWRRGPLHGACQCFGAPAPVSCSMIGAYCKKGVAAWHGLVSPQKANRKISDDPGIRIQGAWSVLLVGGGVECLSQVRSEAGGRQVAENNKRNYPGCIMSTAS